MSKSLQFLILRLARVNFMYAVDECKNCRTFETGRLLAFTKVFENHKQHLSACTMLAASDVPVLKGSQLPLSLVVAFWFGTRVGDEPAVSSKIKNTSRTFAFLRRSCWAKTCSKIAVCRSSNFKVRELESLIRGQDTTKNCLIKKLLWLTTFVCFLFSRVKLVRVRMFSLILWKFPCCNCLSILFFVVVHRSRDENKLLHIRTYC